MIFTHQGVRQRGNDWNAALRGYVPKVHFKLNEPSGATLANRGSAGNAFNGTITGTVTYGATGIPSSTDKAITFPGTAGNYAGTANGVTTANAVMTVGCWFKCSSATAVLTFMVVRSTASGSGLDAPIVLILNHTATGKVTNNSGGLNSAVSAASTYNDGNWHLAVAAIDGSGAYLWIDGAFSSGAYGGLSANNVALGLGANVSNVNIQHFPGTTDEPFVIVGRLLSQAQVASLYNAGRR
jgi:hypothetical protein